ncbi:methionyl-tRNA formyltransferase [Synechococcales cyanobacterium C]|uniref:Methionyl-tRNA formyltransferase n=1 Tax=Petrachloros mirabilis ULC683 TaxID=2781853 RepID=A0A8K2A7P8_9CYAN|nr:methionyl-tRNA formyltransferase [Petrachloros mirabilis ULC683]
MFKVVFWGTPEFAVPSLQRLIAEPGIEVVGVVTQPDKRRGRGNQQLPSPVKSVAVTANLPLWQPKSVKRDRSTLAVLTALQADAFVVVAYGQILSPEILGMPRWGCINGHGSLLPQYRGAAPIQWALYHGETVTGMTTMLMDAGMDTGPILLKDSVAVGLLENAQDLAMRLSHQAAELLVETLWQLERGTLHPTPQEEALASYAPLIHKADFSLDWSRAAIALHNQVRGFTPHCVTQYRGQPLKVLATVPLDAAVLPQLPAALQALSTSVPLDSTQPPGTVIHLAKGHGPVVQTGAGPLLLATVQLAGKRRQSGWDFANGIRLALGDCFESGV